MLSTHSIENFLEHFPPGLHDIVWELRNIVASVAPMATEVVRRNGLVYFHQQRGGPVSAGICQILIHPDAIHLGFIHGAFLPDPGKLLEGDRQYKRYVKIVSYDQAPWGALKDLISASSNFSPASIPSRPGPDGYRAT